MKKETSGAGTTVMKTNSSEARGTLMKVNSSGGGAVSFLRRLRSHEQSTL